METKSSFKKRAEAAFKRSNPEVSKLTIQWTRCELVKWADGSPGYSGSFKVSAPGFKSKTMLASSIDDSIMVR